MQALLSFENAPPFAAPLRFFLTAPAFGMLGGLLLAWVGADIMASRWMPATLALTHLITIGFMLQIMLGALIQILPVVAGANLPRPLALARVLNIGLSLGALLLAGGFLHSQPRLLGAGGGVLGLTASVFLLAAAQALRGVPTTSPTIRGLKLAMVGLGGVVGFGLLLVLALVFGWNVPLQQLVDLHAGWGLAGWGGVLLAAVAFVVVPMFQLTPGYPARPSWWFPRLILAVLLLWTLAVLAGWPALARVCQALAAASGIVFALLTMRLQSLRRRARPDVTYRYWQLGLIAAIFALIMLFTAAVAPGIADDPRWTIAFGVILMAGGFIPFIIGMIYKIVPFLAWLHLQNCGQAKVPAPAMNKLLPDAEMQAQWRSYLVAFVLLTLACLFPEVFARAAGVAYAVANAWLMVTLLRAIRRYRQHTVQILEKLAAR